MHAGEAFLQRRILEAVPHGVERHQRVHPWRLDTAPAPVGLLVGEDPLFGDPARALPERLHRQPVVDAKRAVHGKEEAIDVVARRTGLGAFDVKLVETRGLGDGADGAIVHQQQERDDRAACPGRKPIDAERSLGRQEHQLRRHDGQIVPAPLAEQGQPDAREGPGRGDAAARADELSRARHVRRIG